MDLSRYDQEFSLVPAGFNNLGFTCYYNSLLQGLLSCTSFVEEILGKSYDNSNLLRALRYMICKMHDLETASTPAILAEIQRLGPVTWKLMIQQLPREFSQFAAGQQCVAEGFSLLLQAIEKYENIQNLFTYRRRNKIFCDDCNTYFSDIYETNNIFEVEPQASASANLNDFLLNQKNQIDSDCVCSNCGVRSEKQKTSTLVMVPEILFVMAKKYKYENGRGEKLNIYVNFPEILTFGSKNKSPLEYQAVAQIEHYGAGINGGHYAAICRRKGGWFCINDAVITPSKFKPTENTYIVVYHVF